MALSRIVALLSLVAALLLLARALPFRHGSSRLRGPGAALADLLLDAVARLDGVSLVDLATRRNMVLLCHAILLLLLLLGVPPAQRRRQSRATAAATCFHSAPIVWRARDRAPSASRRATIVPPPGHVNRQRRAARTTVAAAEPEREDHVATEEIVLLEDRHHVDAGELDRPDGKSITPMDFARIVVVDREKIGAEEDDEAIEAEPEHGFEEEEEEEDLDEMNRRFEAFIAATKEKMRLEAMQQQLLHVSSVPQNRALLAR